MHFVIYIAAKYFINIEKREFKNKRHASNTLDFRGDNDNHLWLIATHMVLIENLLTIINIHFSYKE